MKNENYDIAMQYFERGYNHHQNGEWDEALPLFKKAETILRRLGNIKYAREALNLQSITMRMKGLQPTQDMLDQELCDLMYITSGKVITVEELKKSSNDK